MSGKSKIARRGAVLAGAALAIFGPLIGMSSAAGALTLALPLPAKSLAITSPAFTMTASATGTHALTIALQYSSTIESDAPASGTVVDLSSDCGAAWFAATPGGAPITSVKIPFLSSSVTVYYGDAETGPPLITVSSPGLTPATQTETVIP